MKSLTILTALLLLVGLTIVSCKKDDDTKPINTTTTTETVTFWDSQYWYIDTAYNNSEGLMHLKSMLGRRNMFKSDTLWLETSHNGSNTDSNYLYNQSGDTLWFKPQLVGVDSYRMMVIDSLTDSRLHYRTWNVSAPPNGQYPKSDMTITYYEFYR